jgi:hypothetical protein
VLYLPGGAMSVFKRGRPKRKAVAAASVQVTQQASS